MYKSNKTHTSIYSWKVVFTETWIINQMHEWQALHAPDWSIPDSMLYKNIRYIKNIRILFYDF